MLMSRMFPTLALLLVAVLACAGSAAASGSADGGGVQVNGHRLTRAELEALTRVVGGPVSEARYWYDRRSGLWGRLGEPAAGSITPGLELGGPLAPDASGGTSGVFFNGRELSRQELSWLVQNFGAVPKRRYWLNAEGIGGVEGGPATFDLRQAPKQSGTGWNNNSVGSIVGGGAENTEWPGFRIQN